jgi:D-inositol-3-phosphate glycosyltransferase
MKPIQRVMLISVHTSPLTTLGSKKGGGMNVYLRELAHELGARGIAVDIYTRRQTPDQTEIDISIGPNVRVIHITAGGARPLEPDDVYPHLQQFTAGVIAFTMREQLSYDIAYSHYWLSGWVARKLNEAWGLPFVQMFHTLGYMKHRIAPSKSAIPLGDVRTHVETQIVQWAARLIAATPAEESQLVWLYRADQRKIAIVPPGVNLARFQPIAQAEAKAALEIPADEKWVLFVGRIEPLKAVDSVLAAFDHLQRTQPHTLERVRFAIVGGDLNSADERELQRLRALTDELGLQQTVRFLGAKDQALLPTYYAAATALMMPSDYESFGMVALEAMAMGTPVIASEVGGLAFLVRDDVSGFLVPVREPQAIAARLALLLTDDARRDTMGQHAAEIARGYSWTHIADQILAVFDEVLSRRKPQRRLAL